MNCLKIFLSRLFQYLSFICFQREEEQIVLANYVVSTYFYNAFQFTPYIHINSPDFQCGKSTLLDILYELCYNSMKSTDISSAIHRFIPTKGTLLLDEMDNMTTMSVRKWLEYLIQVSVSVGVKLTDLLVIVIRHKSLILTVLRSFVQSVQRLLILHWLIGLFRLL